MILEDKCREFSEWSTESVWLFVQPKDQWPNQNMFSGKLSKETSSPLLSLTRLIDQLQDQAKWLTISLVFFVIWIVPTIFLSTLCILHLERIVGLLKISLKKRKIFNVFWRELLKIFPNRKLIKMKNFQCQSLKPILTHILEETCLVELTRDKFMLDKT